MPLYNVTAVVVANLQAATPEEAQRRLDAALARAGFATYEASDPQAVDTRPFESEDDAEATELPR